MRIDSHHHLWDLSRRAQPWTDDLPLLQSSFHFSDLEPELLAAGLDGTVLVQCLDDTPETLDLLELAAGEPRILGVIGWVDLTARGVADAVAGLQQRVGGEFLVAVRHQVQAEPDPGWLCRPDVRKGLAELADTGLAFDLLLRVEQLPAAVDTVRALPGLQFVLEHAGKPDIAGGRTQPWAAAIRELATSENVAVKLSGLVTQATREQRTTGGITRFAEVVIDAFGPERTLFGSDWPVCTVAARYAEVAELADALVSGWTGPEAARFWGENAARLYQLTAPTRLTAGVVTR